MLTEEELKKQIDFISKLNGLGSLSSAQTNNIRGINIHLNGSGSPTNQDSYGITFFTRPRLNLSYDNLATSRLLTPLLLNDPNSMARAIRNMLDPVGENPNRSVKIVGNVEPVVSNIFDSRQAFIPLLTNNLISISGWPDITVDTYTSKEGIYKESYSMVDGTSYLYGTTDVTANFRNIQGDPITFLFAMWCHYEALVYNGTIVPYPDSIISNEIDYNTRIYRLVMDSEFMYVQKIAATGAAFPTASPLGAAFNYNSDAEFNRDNDQISIPFRCIGFNYLDPILVEEFNKVGEIFNGDLIGVDPTSTTGALVKVSAKALYPDRNGNQISGRYIQNILNNRMYPRINPSTYELEWYAYRPEFAVAIDKISALNTLQANITRLPPETTTG